jgi:hypothetical protein
MENRESLAKVRGTADVVGSMGRLSRNTISCFADNVSGKSRLSWDSKSSNEWRIGVCQLTM